jgi:hypothetical protein
MMESNIKHSMRLNRILQERDYQPEWRGMASRCHQYYDGNQLAPEVIEALKSKKMPILITNLIQPAINGVLGMEARSRTDWFVQADDDEFKDVAEGLNVRVNEGLRTGKANNACAESYKAQIVGGIGWAEVKKNKDPLASKYLIQPVHRNEISFDWRTRNDLSNCRWLLRERWVDKDEAKSAFRNKADIIDQSLGMWSSYDMNESAVKGDVLSQAYREYQYSTRDEKEWLLPHRDMVKVYELYYRVWKDGVVLRTEDGRAVVFDENNPMHVALVNSGRVNISRSPIPSLRLSWYIGPHFVTDMESPHPRNMFPYVPFIGAREDETGIPYGLARPMLSPQDEINFRRIRLTGDLNYKRITMDDDATSMTDNDLRQQAHQADGIIKLNGLSAKRKDGPLFKVESDQGISGQQFQVMQEAKTLIQDVAGIYDSFLGKEGGAKSGVAINSLVEQGATTLAEINDNYHMSRQMIGELVLAHEVEELTEKRNVSVMVPGKLGKGAKQVVLNQQEGEEGEVSNAIAHAKTQVVLGEVQQSAGYRAQVSQMLMDFISKLPGEFQAAGLGLVVEQLDIPEEKRVDLMKLVQKVTGDVDPETMTPEEQEGMAKQQQEQEMLKDIHMKDIQLKLEELIGKINKTEAEAKLTEAKTETEKVKQQEMIADIQRESETPPPLPSSWLQTA